MSRIMKVIECTAVKSMPSSPRISGSTFVPRSTEIKKQISLLDESIESDKKTHEQNIEAIENNKRLIEEIESFMSDIGIAKTYTAPDPKSRAYIPKRKTFNAGYIEDIRREIKIDDGYTNALSLFERYKDSYESALRVALLEEEKEKAKKEKERKKMESYISMGIVISRHGLELEHGYDNWSDVLDALCEKDKYLNLAVAMNMTRNNWNEGYGRVISALGKFSVETDIDKEIVEDVSSVFENEDIDGRYFRDIEWNYDRIYELVQDEQLFKDAMLALEKADQEGFWY